MSDKRWIVLMNLGTFPLGLLSWLTQAVGDLLIVISDICWQLRYQWVGRVRVWSGRTPEGLTKEQVAAQEAKREALLAELRRPLPR